MNKIKFAKLRSFFKGKGFAGALCLSLAAIGISTYIAYDNALGDITSQSNITPESSAQPVDNNVSGVPKDESSKTDTQSDNTGSSSDAPANNFILNTSERVMPIDSEILVPYSNGELVKSETLGVWKTHDGIDIAAEEGTEVKSAAAGKVTAIKDDPLWGVCVIIDHYDGYEGHYYGLDKALSVKQEQEIAAGEIIGKTALIDCEIKTAPHLHFGVKCNDAWINPEEFIGG